MPCKPLTAAVAPTACRLVILDGGLDSQSARVAEDDLDPIAWALKSEVIPLAHLTQQDYRCTHMRIAAEARELASRDLDQVICMHRSVGAADASKELDVNSSKLMLRIEI